MTHSPGTGAKALAIRLRDLRQHRWDRPVRQAQLGIALGCSVPLISSWESQDSNAMPTPARLRDYAAFFSTERSITGGSPRILSSDELTPEERAEFEALQHELTGLREAADRDAPRATSALAGPAAPDPWRFPEGEPVTIVCGELPEELRAGMPYVDHRDPDYIALYRFADPDALLELYGYIRKVNPNNPVEYKTASAMTATDYTTHLALIGGVDLNEATRFMLEQLARFDATRDMTVRQETFNEQPDAGFRAGDRTFTPVTIPEAGLAKPRLLEDVTHFFRGPNPMAEKRTLTFCNGMYGRGTLGAVLSLTKDWYRDRNAAYVQRRFAGSRSYSILSRVRIVRGVVVPPDWTVAENILHEWPPPNL